MESEIPFPWQQEVIETFRAMPEQSGKSWLINYLKTLDAADQLVKKES